MSESIRQLRHVLALCEHRNYRRAAEALHLTQSALSVSIRRIEEDYGVALFTRERSGVAPTEFGEIVARVARQTTSTLDQGRREIELLRNLGSGQVVIGSDPWMADSIVAPALARLLRKHPKLRFRLRTQGWDELQGDLLERKVDVYVGSPFGAPDAGVRAQPFELSSPVILCRHDHPLTHMPRIEIRDVLPYPLLVPKLPGWYLSWLAEHYGGPRSSEDLHDLFLRAEDLTVIRRIVRETDAITASVINTFPPELSAEDFAMLDIADLSHVASPGVIATLAGRPIPVAAEAFIAEVLAEIRDLRSRLRRIAPTGRARPGARAALAAATARRAATEPRVRRSWSRPSSRTSTPSGPCCATWGRSWSRLACGPPTTSSISITALGSGSRRPEGMVGMHLFNPVPLMKLVEVVSVLRTDPALADAVFAIAQSWGKVPVHARSTPGLIVNRIARPCDAAALVQRRLAMNNTDARSQRDRAVRRSRHPSPASVVPEGTYSQPTQPR